MSTKEPEWLGRTRDYAKNSLDKIRSALSGGRVNIGLLLNDMRSALNWALGHWFQRRGEGSFASWADQEARFLRTAPAEIQDHYLRVAGMITDVAEGLREHYEAGMETVTVDAPSFARWRDQVYRWIDDADSLVTELTEPSLPSNHPPGTRLVARGRLESDLRSLAPCFVVTQAGGQYGRSPDGGQTPGMFHFGEPSDQRTQFNANTGLILPFSLCHDPDLQRRLHALADHLRSLLAQSGTAYRRCASLQAWLERDGLKGLTPPDREDVGPWTRFALTRDAFAMLSHFDHVSALLDCAGQPAQIVERQPFRWASQGELLDWCSGNAPEAVLQPFRLYLATDVTGYKELFTSEARRLFRPLAYWTPFTKASPEVPAAPVSVRITQDEADYGWAVLTVTLGEQTAEVILSDVYDPLPTLLEWLQAVANGDLPIAFDVDEEGSIARFIAHAFDDERLLVAVTDRWGQTARAAAVVDRAQFLTAFKNDLRRFLTEELDEDRWQPSGDGHDEETYVTDLLAHPFLMVG